MIHELDLALFPIYPGLGMLGVALSAHWLVQPPHPIKADITVNN